MSDTPPSALEREARERVEALYRITKDEMFADFAVALDAYRAAVLESAAKPDAFGPVGEMCESPSDMADQLDLGVGDISVPLYGIRFFPGPYFLAVLRDSEDEDCQVVRVYDRKEDAEDAIRALKEPTR